MTALFASKLFKIAEKAKIRKWLKLYNAGLKSCRAGGRASECEW